MGATENSINSKDCLPGEAKKILESLATEWGDVPDVNALQVIPLKGAMTNQVFQIKWPTETKEVSRKVLVRIYGEGVEVFFDRNNEIQTFESMSKNGQGPRLLGRFQNGRIEEFIHARLLPVDHQTWVNHQDQAAATSLVPANEGGKESAVPKQSSDALNMDVHQLFAENTTSQHHVDKVFDENPPRATMPANKNENSELKRNSIKAYGEENKTRDGVDAQRLIFLSSNIIASLGDRRVEDINPTLLRHIAFAPGLY
ncbi:Choline kinase [Quillaja saponaria]|uniref:Choline kinase n=1 Tax=Quillaja saponaria TaxID=32244 RepID=A0AAD7QJ03_QUISA|nr:Choline kinase [Quillaja saponaria]